MEDNNKPNCPLCNEKTEVISILYGYLSPEGMKEAQEGKIFLGGCGKIVELVDEKGNCIGIKKPEKWRCKKCSKSF